jgi:hypothetical protein
MRHQHSSGRRPDWPRLFRNGHSQAKHAQAADKATVAGKLPRITGGC